MVVLGAGVLGLCAAGAAKALGARKVIISAKYDAQAALAKRFGADVVLRSGEADLVERIRAETGSHGADLVVETVGGHAPTLSQALEILRPGCFIVVLGLWDEPVPVDSWGAVLKDAHVLFSLTYGVKGKRHDFELVPGVDGRRARCPPRSWSRTCGPWPRSARPSRWPRTRARASSR